MLVPVDKSRFDPHFYQFLPDYSYGGRSSRVEELLRQNISPHDFEKSSLRETLARGRDHVQLLQEKVAATRILLDYLEAEEERTLSIVSDARALLHPLRDIPDEILREIFVVAVMAEDDGGIGLDTDLLDTRKAAWTLSHVCHQWRAVALTSQGLWSDIYLSFMPQNSYRQRLRERAWMLGVVLDRSRSQNLSVTIISDDDLSSDPLWLMLIPTAPRWKRAHLELPFSTFQSLSGCKAFFSRLTRLDVYSDPPEEDNFQILDAFSIAPRLTTLELKAQESDLYDIPYHEITAFITSDQMNHDHLRLLAGMPNLEELILHHGAASSQALTPASVTLANVVVFELGEASEPEGQGSATQLLTHLLLPSLQALSLILNSEMSPVFPNNFPHAGTITFLSLRFSLLVPEDTQSLEAFLRRLPKVTALKIRSQNLPASFFDMLTISADKEPVLPSLIHLDLGRCTPSDDSSRLKIDVVILSRQNHCARCTSLEEVIWDGSSIGSKAPMYRWPMSLTKRLRMSEDYDIAMPWQ